MERSGSESGAAAATRWPLLLSFIAALAGLVAAAAAVGGAVIWARLNELGLPAGRLLTIVPADDLITVGLNALAVPLLLALAAVLAVMAFCPVDNETGEPREELLATMLALFAIVVIWAIPSLGFRLVPELLLMIGAVIVAAGAIYATAKRSRGRRPVAWVAFVAFTTIGAIVAVASELSDPELEPVALLLEDNPAGIAGFMVADTADHAISAG